MKFTVFLCGNENEQIILHSFKTFRIELCKNCFYSIYETNIMIFITCLNYEFLRFIIETSLRAGFCS